MSLRVQQQGVHIKTTKANDSKSYLSGGLFLEHDRRPLFYRDTNGACTRRQRRAV